jgi:prepilin-type N-terminal cleavage/methylation domain-containing protein
MNQRPRKTVTRKKARSEGFTLIEVLIGVFLVAVAVLGLIQLYTMSLLNNVRASEIANSVFLAQQEIDYLRTLTLTELNSFPNTTRGEADDEALDLNVDGTTDFRRITVLTNRDPSFDVTVLVFPPSQRLTSRADLVADPEGHRVRARLATMITR